MNLPTYNISSTAQQKNQPQKMRQMLAQEECDILKIILPFLLKTSTHTIHIQSTIRLSEIHLTFAKGSGRHEIIHHKGREILAGLHKEFSI